MWHRRSTASTASAGTPFRTSTTPAARRHALPDGLSLLQNANVQTVNAERGVCEHRRGPVRQRSPPPPAAQGGAGFSSQWNGNFVSNMRAQLTQSSDSSVNMSAIASAIRHAFNERLHPEPELHRVAQRSHRGGQRLTTLIDPSDPTGWLSLKKSTLGAAILFTSPGSSHDLSRSRICRKRTAGGERAAAVGPRQRIRRHSQAVGQRWRRPAPIPPAIRRTWQAIVLNIYEVDNTNKFIAYERFDSQAAGVSIVVANFTGSTRTGVRRGTARLRNMGHALQ